MIDSHKLGIVFGGFFALVHMIWVLLVVAGWAGPILAFIYRIHFIDVSFAIADFNVGNALMLVVFTSLVGYLIGMILAVIWNFTCKETKEDYVIDKGY